MPLTKAGNVKFHFWIELELETIENTKETSLYLDTWLKVAKIII